MRDWSVWNLVMRSSNLKPMMVEWRGEGSELHAFDHLMWYIGQKRLGVNSSYLTPLDIPMKKTEMLFSNGSMAIVKKGQPYDVTNHYNRDHFLSLY